MALKNARNVVFRVRTSNEFLYEDIADLAAGRCAAIRVPNCISAVTNRQMLDVLSKTDFESYGERRVFPVVKRFGVAVSDHREDGGVRESYWHSLHSAKNSWNQLGLGFDVFEFCRDALGKHWQGPVVVGQRGGREMGPGVVREPNGGFVVHFDDASREFSGDLLDDHLVSQFAFNLYLSVPEHGGQTVVWRHRWSPADEAHRIPNSYGYYESVVDWAESIEIEPQVGEAVLVDSRNYHAVRPSAGSRRIALGFSVGLSTSGALLTWG